MLCNDLASGVAGAAVGGVVGAVTGDPVTDCAHGALAGYHCRSVCGVVGAVVGGAIGAATGDPVGGCALGAQVGALASEGSSLLASVLSLQSLTREIYIPPIVLPTMPIEPTKSPTVPIMFPTCDDKIYDSLYSDPRARARALAQRKTLGRCACATSEDPTASERPSELRQAKRAMERKAKRRRQQAKRAMERNVTQARNLQEEAEAACERTAARLAPQGSREVPSALAEKDMPPAALKMSKHAKQKLRKEARLAAAASSVVNSSWVVGPFVTDSCAAVSRVADTSLVTACAWPMDQSRISCSPSASMRLASLANVALRCHGDRTVLGPMAWLDGVSASALRRASFSAHARAIHDLAL